MDTKNEKNYSTSCCIVGGGPAGMMLGFLLARAGIDVIVLEKHKDFFRDFRGDTIHPSTINIMYELGLLDEFLKVPHQEIQYLTAVFNNVDIHLVDFTHLNIAKPVLGIMPQWDFLNFIAAQAVRYPSFRLIREASVTELIQKNERVTGVKAQTPDGIIEISAGLVVGSDGRSSTVREQAKLNVIKTGAPIDVLWFRVSTKQDDPPQTLGRFDHGRIMVLIERGSYWQCAYVIAKGGFDKIKENGFEAFKAELSQVTPFLSNRVDELKSWDDIMLLSVAIDHLEKWYCDGLLCIGDAAHAMSPVGGVGINLAVQDAVAAANILYRSLKEKKEVPPQLLMLIQKRREYPARIIQRLQVFIQNNIIKSRVNADKTSKPPLIMRLFNVFPILRRIPARVIGMDVRPEHVATPDVLKK